jgi:mannose-6-phosphate isomerase-like protein (cupin superfamily)
MTMLKFQAFLAAAALALSANAAIAADPFTYTSAADTARLVAAKDGKISTVHVITRHPGFLEQIVERTATGESEIHGKWTDYIIFLDGDATLVIGGTLDAKKPSGPNEWRGTGISGGKEYPIKPGVLVTIPAGTPHWMKVPAGGRTRFITVKQPGAADPFAYTGAAQAAASAVPPKSGGIATHFFSKHDNFQELIAARNKSGQVEIHDKYTDYIIVEDGAGTLTIGGTVADKKQTGPGEWRGASSSGGKVYKLEPGVLVTIPAATPHWMQVPTGGHLRYITVKKSE